MDNCQIKIMDWLKRNIFQTWDVPCFINACHFCTGAFPIFTHVLPSTFSCFKSSAPIGCPSKQVSKGCREVGPVLVSHSMAKRVPVPEMRLLELPAEGCFSGWFCLTCAMTVTTPTALLFAWLGFLCSFCRQWQTVVLHHHPSGVGWC